jgi:hypothetical protein
MMANALMVIKPYWYEGTWVFDDEATCLEKEPFVEGIPEMIEDLVKEIPNARDGFRMIFSAQPFPNYQKELKWVDEDYGGNWYRDKDSKIKGWLCPALFRYFEVAPQKLYVKAEQIPL